MWIHWKYIRYYVCTIFSRQSTIVSIFFSCDQVALRTLLSVLIRPSVCDAFFTMFLSSYHHEFFRSYYHWQKWCPCKRSRSKVKVTEVKTILALFRTVTPVRIHIWWWNNAKSLMLLRRDALLFLRSSIKFQGHTAKELFFNPNWAFPDCDFSLNSPMATEWWTKLEEVSYSFTRSSIKF